MSCQWKYLKETHYLISSLYMLWYQYQHIQKPHFTFSCDLFRQLFPIWSVFLTKKVHTIEIWWRFVVDLLACSNIALVVLVLPFCKIKVSYHTYLIFSPQMMAFLCMLTLWSWTSAMRCRDRMKCCFKSGGNNYYKYLAVYHSTAVQATFWPR